MFDKLYDKESRKELRENPKKILKDDEINIASNSEIIIKTQSKNTTYFIILSENEIFAMCPEKFSDKYKQNRLKKDLSDINAAGQWEATGCIGGAITGGRLGSVFGPWAGVAGGAIGCGIGWYAGSV